MKVFITGIIPDVVKRLLIKNGFKVSIFKKERPILKNELIRSAKDAEAIMPLVSDLIDSEVIDNLKKCKIIANLAVGYNNIDVEYAASKGITVTNTPGVLTNATADLAVSLILACARHVVKGHNFVREGKFVGWKPKLFLGMELSGKTVGIVGAGRIGYETAKRMRAFGTKIVYHNRSKKTVFEEEFKAKRLSLNKLLERSDIISLHLPLTEKTYHILNKTNLGRVKNGAILVNTARGEIMDEKEVIRLLQTGQISSAGFDVYENEPKISKQLLLLDNVVLLPHIGSATNEARGKMAELAAQNVVNVLRGKSPLTPVN